MNTTNHKETIINPIINTENLYNSYLNICTVENINPENKITFCDRLINGLSVMITKMLKHQDNSIAAKFPIDQHDNIWCFIVPKHDGTLLFSIDTEQNINELIQQIINFETNKFVLSDQPPNPYIFSPIDQF